MLLELNTNNGDSAAVQSKYSDRFARASGGLGALCRVIIAIMTSANVGNLLKGLNVSLTFSKITAKGLKGLIVGDTLREHGIVVRRTDAGDLRYSVNVMVDGQRIHRVVGLASDGVTRTIAQQVIEQRRTEARERRLNLPLGRKLHVSFEAAAGDYVERMRAGGGRNVARKELHLGKRLIPAFRDLRIDQITTHHIERYVQSRKGEGASQATVNRELSTLSHFLRRAVEWGWMKADARPSIRKGVESVKAITVINDADGRALMKAAMADHDGDLWLFVAFGLHTAMRHREILRVRFDQVDFDSKRIFLSQAKAGEREQPITPSLAIELKEERERRGASAGWVFPSINQKAKLPHRDNMTKQFRRAVIRAGLDPSKVTPHVMRHTAITRLVRAGVDIPTIQRISGHKTLAMVLRYVHLHGRHIDEAITALNSPITHELHATTLRDGRAGSDVSKFL